MSDAAREEMAMLKRRRLVRKKLKEIARLEEIRNSGTRELNEDELNKVSSAEAFREEEEELEALAQNLEACGPVQPVVEEFVQDTGGEQDQDPPFESWGTGDFSELIPGGGWSAPSNQVHAPALPAATSAPAVPDDDDFWGGGPEAQAKALADVQAAAVANAKKAGEVELEDDEWLVKGKDGKVKVVKESAKKKKKKSSQTPANAASPDAADTSLPSAETQAAAGAAGKAEEEVKGASGAVPAATVRAPSPTPVPQTAGARPPVRVSQVLSPEEVRRREREELKASLLSTLKGAWREGVFKQTTMEGHRSAIACLHMSGNCLLSGGFDGTIKQWLLPEGTLVRSLGGHTSGVNGVWADKEVFYSGSEDCLIVVWDAATGKQHRSINCFSPIRAMAGDASAGRLYTGHSDRSLRAYQCGANGSDEEIFKLKGAHSAAFTSLSLAAGSDGHLLISADARGECRLWDLGDGGDDVLPTVIWRCNHPEEQVARCASWLPVDRASASSGAAGTLIVAYDPFEIQAWKFPDAADEDGMPRDLSVAGAGMCDEEMRACMSTCHDGTLIVSASTEPDGAGNLVVRLLATDHILYKVAPEDMEGAASMAVNDKYIIFGGLDGWITLLQALEPSKSKGQELARIIRPAPPKPKPPPQAAAKKVKLGASAPGGGGGASSKGAAAEASKGKGKGKLAEKDKWGGDGGGALYAGAAILAAVLAVFVAKVLATLVLQ